MNYIKYNREERNLCSHLFRLLHETQNNNLILNKFLEPRTFTNYEIFSEVALLRDAYYNYKRTSNPINFIDLIISKIIEQEGVSNCRLYSELDVQLTNPKTNHPRQLLQKAREMNYPLSSSEKRVYGCLQAYFNAKPDLAISIDTEILVYEAKLTMPFDEEQLNRTRNIADIWSSVLYKELGFTSQPKTSVLTIGLQKHNPDISWERILDIASLVLDDNDKSIISIRAFLQYHT